jgi:hypothetical protein
MKTQKRNNATATLSDLARQFQRDRGTIRRWLELAGLKPVKTTKNTTLFNLDAATKVINQALASRNDSLELQNLKLRRIGEQVRRLKLENDAKENLLVEREKLFAAFAQIGGEISQILYQKLECEYPSTVSGMDIPACRIMGGRVRDSILAEIRKLDILLQNL